MKRRTFLLGTGLAAASGLWFVTDVKGASAIAAVIRESIGDGNLVGDAAERFAAAYAPLLDARQAFALRILEIFPAAVHLLPDSIRLSIVSTMREIVTAFVLSSDIDPSLDYSVTPLSYSGYIQDEVGCNPFARLRS